jgi:prolyl oligopeptidase
MQEFLQSLRTDPKYFFQNANDLLEYCRARAKEIDPKLVKLFRSFPRLPYGVEPVPSEIAPGMPEGYADFPAPDGSRPGIFYINTYKPETRPKYDLTSLILHEAIPGHTFQGGIAIELKNIPKFRRYGGYSAYVEGWALYSESLGYEMKLYDDPYVRFGALSNEMWRAVRLVVDTGMHYKHWTRQQAIDYFLAHVATSEFDATNEVDRYISWPGQALAYKIGELKIKELREKAAKKLGPKFDLRAFHDAVLLEGPLPLTVLEKQVNGWIERESGEAK